MPITTWVPLFIFPILFGLSTDYEVFLISRIREEYDAGATTREAVARGLSHTARVITAAAAIMVLVFATVLLGGDIAVKQFGLGLAVAVLLDATLVRMVLVPALMELLGAANWWLPRWLARVLPSRRDHPSDSTIRAVVDRGRRRSLTGSGHGAGCSSVSLKAAGDSERQMMSAPAAWRATMTTQTPPASVRPPYIGLRCTVTRTMLSAIASDEVRER